MTHRTTLTPRILLVTCVIASVAHAGQTTHSTNVGPLAPGASATVTLPPFDGSAGVLRSTHVTLAARVSGTLSFENTNASAITIGGVASGHGVGAFLPWQVAGSSAGAAPNPAYVPAATSLAAYDGITDHGGASGVTFTFADHAGDGAPSQTANYFADFQLTAFTGANPVSVQVGAVFQIGPNAPPGVVRTATITTSATVTVRYEFDALPAQICRTSPSSGCPCGNASHNGVGCANSISTFGGNLVASGVASLSNDTLTLTGSGMTNSSALYFQGPNFVYAQSVYGDGLRCVTGTIRRLGTRTNSAGTSQVPGPGGTSISVVGTIAAPGTRYYQCVYRDLGAYCTASTFNVTSGLAIAWSI